MTANKESVMSDKETKTLCALQEEGYIESHKEDFKRLIQPARSGPASANRIPAILTVAATLTSSLPHKMEMISRRG